MKLLSPSPVVLYALPGCEQARPIRGLLDRHAVPFREVNVLAEPRAWQKILARHGRELPLVVVGDQALPNPTLDQVSSTLGLPVPGAD